MQFTQQLTWQQSPKFRAYNGLPVLRNDLYLSLFINKLPQKLNKIYNTSSFLSTSPLTTICKNFVVKFKGLMKLLYFHSIHLGHLNVGLDF